MAQSITSNIISQLNTYELYDYLIKNPEQYDNIYKLNISELNNEYKQKYIDILYKFKNLTELECSYCNQLSDNAFNHLPNLTSLICDNCDQLTDNAFNNLPNLTSLDCSHCNLLTDNVFNKLTILIKVNYYKCPLIQNNH